MLKSVFYPVNAVGKIIIPDSLTDGFCSEKVARTKKSDTSFRFVRRITK